jgi:hypothetical protein
MDPPMQLVVAIPLWLLLWAVLSSPLLLGFYLVARYMRRKSVRTAAAVITLSLAATLLIAPIPTPIITVFVPHAFVLVDSDYYAPVSHGAPTLSGMWPWVVGSLITTFVVAWAVSWRYLRRPMHRSVSAQGEKP